MWPLHEEMSTLGTYLESLCLIYAQPENTEIDTRRCLSRTVQHIHLSNGRAHCERRRTVMKLKRGMRCNQGAEGHLLWSPWSWHGEEWLKQQPQQTERNHKSGRRNQREGEKNQQKEKCKNRSVYGAQQHFHLQRSTANCLFTELRQCKCCLPLHPLLAGLSFSVTVLTLNGQGWRTKPRCPGSLCPSSTGMNPSQPPWQVMKPGMKQRSYQRPAKQ